LFPPIAIVLPLSHGHDPFWLHVFARIPPATTAVFMVAGTLIPYILDLKEYVREPVSLRFGNGRYMVYIGPVEHGPKLPTTTCRPYRKSRSRTSPPWPYHFLDVVDFPPPASFRGFIVPSEQSIHLSDVATLTTSPSLREEVRRSGHDSSSSREGTEKTDGSQLSDSDDPHPRRKIRKKGPVPASESLPSTRSGEISSLADHSDSGRNG
jgi:hypothetical protein